AVFAGGAMRWRRVGSSAQNLTVVLAPQATHRKPRGSGEPRKEPPVRERRSRRVQLGVRAAGDGRITTGTGRGRRGSWGSMRRGEDCEGRLLPLTPTA